MKKYLQWIFAISLVMSSAALAHEGHDHVATNPLQVEWGLQGARELINIHPLFVHFPIAFLLGSLVFYVLGLILKKDPLLYAGKWTLCLGALTSAIAVWTGLHAAGTVPHGGESHQIMMVHQYLGITILVLSGLLSLWVLFSKASIPGRGRTLFVTLLFVLALLAVQQNDFGGRMVYQHGVGVGKKSMAQKQAQDHETTMRHGEGHDHGDHHH